MPATVARDPSASAPLHLPKLERRYFQSGRPRGHEVRVGHVGPCAYGARRRGDKGDMPCVRQARGGAKGSPCTCRNLLGRACSWIVHGSLHPVPCQPQGTHAPRRRPTVHAHEQIRILRRRHAGLKAGKRHLGRGQRDGEPQTRVINQPTRRVKASRLGSATLGGGGGRDGQGVTDTASSQQQAEVLQ